MAAAGTLWIEMAANLARLQQDMNQAKGMVGDSMKNIERTVGQAKTALGALGAGLSYHAIREKIDSVTEGMAKLQDATEKTGSSVEKMSQLQFFAGISGSNLEGVSGALAKLSKGMVNTGNDTADTTQALKYLGLSAKTASGDLKDPADLFTEIAGKLFDYEDGAGKAALAQALFGKTGAQLLPMLKKMAEMGSVQASVTTEQAQAAENYQIQQALLNRQSEILHNQLVSALLPSMKAFTEVMIDASKETTSMNSAGQRLAADGSIEHWADRGAMAVAILIDGIKLIPSILSSVASSFQVVWADLQLADAAGSVFNPLKRAMALAQGKDPFAEFKEALANRNAVLESANKKYDDLLNGEVDKTQKAMARRIALNKANSEDEARDSEGSSRASPKKKPNFAPTDAKQAAAELKLYEGAVKRLQHELADVSKQSESEKLNFEMYGQDFTMADGSIVHLTGSLEKLSAAHKEVLPLIAAEVDRRKQLIEVSNLQFASTEAMWQSQQKLLAIQTSTVESDQNYLEDLKFQVELIGKTVIEQTKMNEVRKIDLKLRSDLKAAADAAGDNMAQYDAARGALTQQAEEQKRAVLSSFAERTNAERSWSTGAAAAFNEYVDNATNAALQAKNAFTSAFRALEDTLFEFIRHGKIGIKDFIGLIKDQFARLAAQQITLQIAGSVAGTLGMGSAAAGATGLGGASSALSLASGANSLYGLASGSGPIGAAIGAYSGVTGAVAAEGAMYAVGGTVAEGVMAGAAAGLAAIPVWGWAALAAMAVLGMGGGGGPKPSQLAIHGDASGLGLEPINVNGSGNIDAHNPAYDQAAAILNALPADLRAGLAGLSVTTDPSDNADQMIKALFSTPELNAAFKEAATRTKDLATSTAELAVRHALEIRFMEAQGDVAGVLAAKRKDELAAADDLSQALLRQIYAAEDAATAQRELVDLENARKQGVLDAVGVLRNAYEREATTLEQMAGRWHDAAAGLRAYGDTLIGTASGGLSYAAAARNFSDVARRAQLGDLDAVGSLQAVSERFRTASLSNSGSSLDYARDVGRISAVINNVADLADRQESVALQQRDLLKSQVDELIDVNGNLVSVKDAIALLKSQVSDLTKVTKSTADDTKDMKDIIEAVTQGQLSFSTEAAA